MGANPLMGGRFEMLQSYVQTPRQREINFGKVVLKEVAGAFPKRDEFWDSCAQELDSSDLAFSVASQKSNALAFGDSPLTGLPFFN
jgi:hypothetical protein